MDWVNVISQYPMGVAAGVAFMGGIVFGRLARSKSAAKTEDPRNKVIRQLEADLKVAQKRLADSETLLARKAEEVEQGMATLTDLQSELNQRDREAARLRDELKNAVIKTRELRQVLTDKAEQTLREQVKAKEALTELEVVRAGTEAMYDEIPS